MEKNYNRWYEKISAPFRAYPSLLGLLNGLNKGVTALIFVTYPLLLVWLLWKKDERFWKILLVPAISFILLSLARKAIDRARPYETFPEMRPLIKKDTRGHSMPSRHVFSSMIIAMAFLSVWLPVGILYVIFTGLEMFVRVIGGVHYLSDVLAGAFIGIGAGIFLFLL